MAKISIMKGKRGEIEVANMLKAVLPEARRRPLGAETQCDQGRDLDGTGYLVCQVNLSKRPPIERKWSEALAASRDGEVPVAFTRRCSRTEHGPWLATLAAEDLVRLLQAVKAGGLCCSTLGCTAHVVGGPR